MGRKRALLLASVAAVAGLAFGAGVARVGLTPGGTAGERPATEDSAEEIRGGRPPSTTPEDAGPASAGTVPEVESDGPPLPGKLAKSASMEIAVGEGGVDGAATRAEEIAASLGGYPARSNRSDSGDGRRTASLVLRVPADRFEEALRRLGDLGETLRLETSAEDQSSKIVDLDARIRNKEAHRDRLLAIMAEARSVQETLSVQDRLQSVTEELEVLKAQKAGLESKTSYATTSVSITEDHTGDFTGKRPGNFGYWDRAVRVFTATLGVIIVALAPVLALAVVVVPAGWALRSGVRRFRRRS